MAFLGTLVWVLAVAPSPAAAERDDDWRPDGPGWDLRGGSRATDPLGWLRRSRDGFQDVMHKLARRSAGLPGPRTRPRAERDWPPIPPGGPEPDKPWPSERPSEWPPERPQARPQERRRVAEPGPGRDRDRPGGPRVKEWHQSRSPSCRKAGVPVEGAGWYVVAPGDTLWRIARMHYGNGRAWRRILHANWETIADGNLIYACQRLFIPRWKRDRPPPSIPPCDDPEPPRRVCHRPRCDEPRPWPPRTACQRPPPRPDRDDRVGPAGGPGGCTRCGAGANVGSWGWR